jgi:peptidoglycan/LPS O-acetylase OafA/YrhL
MRACRLDQEVLYRYTPFRIDDLLLGGCIALARRGPSPRSLMIVARVGFVVLSVALLSWLVSNPTARHDISGGYVYPVWRFTWGLSFIDAYAACILVMALEPGSIAFRLLNLSSLRWLGRISYPSRRFFMIPLRSKTATVVKMKFTIVVRLSFTRPDRDERGVLSR